jgi:hypothetical protein
MKKILTRIGGSIKSAWMNYLEKLAKANEKNYGHRKLDCCDMNQQKK